MSLRLPIAHMVTEALSVLEHATDGLGYFVASGVRVRHVGCLLDQPAAAKVVAEVEQQLVRDFEPAVVTAVLGRVTVVIGSGQYRRDETVFDVFSEWEGGVRDRGVVYLTLIEGEWQKNFAAALLALAKMDLGP